MKKYLIILFCLISYLSFGQDRQVNGYYENLINFEPKEVTSSAILIFNFEDSKEISYKLISNNKVILTTTFNKNEGKIMRKVDFSTLKKGVYLIEYYIDDKKVKQLTFSKL